ncbi:MAG: integrase family protein [Actinomycetia bacterium]|nr:integrase family protein [Actinomycetes bacterium]
MTQAAPAQVKIPTKSPQPAPGRATRASARAKRGGGPSRTQVLAAGTGRAATRGGGEVIELEYGITVYPARSEGGRWRAVWCENDERQQCEAATEEKLTAKLAKVRTRLEADAPNMVKPGADLIAHYLDPDRLPVGKRWSRKHAHTQRRLCERFATPVIAAVACEDIRTGHMQKIVNAAPTAGEGDRVRRMISALVTAGVDAGYLVNSRLAKPVGVGQVDGRAVAAEPQWSPHPPAPADADVGLGAVVDADLPQVGLGPGNELIVECPGFRGDAGFPVRFGARFPGYRPGRAGHVEVLVDHDSLRDQDHLGLPAPGPQLDHHQGQVICEGFQGGPLPVGGAFHHQDSDMGLALESHAVACPVVKDPEAVRCVDFPELHLHAVVGVTVGGKDVQASAARCGQFLGDDRTSPRPSRAGSSASQFCSQISS